MITELLNVFEKVIDQVREYERNHKLGLLYFLIAWFIHDYANLCINKYIFLWVRVYDSDGTIASVLSTAVYTSFVILHSYHLPYVWERWLTYIN